MNMEYLNIWYTDEAYVNSIYNQLNDDVSNKIQKRKSFKGNIELCLNNKLLKNFIGFTNKNDLIFENGIIEEKEIKMNLENKIHEIIKYVNGDLQSKFISFLLNPSDITEGIFYFNGCFELTELYYIGHPTENLTLNTSKILKPNELVWHFEFKYNKRYINAKPSDGKIDLVLRHCYTIETNNVLPQYKIDMYVDGDKICRNVKHLTKHIEMGHDFYFSILGDITYLEKNTYSVKPIVILR